MTLVERLHETGILRLGAPRRHRYRFADGRPVSARERERIAGLRIPPRWKDVAIDPAPRARVQAVGRDAAGRWQYLYHVAHAKRREREKFERLVRFVRALPAMRRAVARDLARPGLSREKVLACVVRVISVCFLRPGSQVYVSENGSFGITTIRRRHVTVRGDTVFFDFPGKFGKRQARQMRDRRVARIVRRLRALAGRGLFQFEDGEGSLFDVRRRHVNAYLKEIMGSAFSARDFRTWAGTLLCAGALARAGADPTDTRIVRRRKIVSAVREAAENLGNTPAICRSSYISPRILDSFERGRVIGQSFRTVEELVARRSGGLHRCERALLRLLQARAA